MIRKVLIVLGLILTAGMLFYNSADTHSGRTDANGGHYNRKTGEYHYHNSGRSRFGQPNLYSQFVLFNQMPMRISTSGFSLPDLNLDKLNVKLPNLKN